MPTRTTVALLAAILAVAGCNGGRTKATNPPPSHDNRRLTDEVTNLQRQVEQLDAQLVQARRDLERAESETARLGDRVEAWSQQDLPGGAVAEDGRLILENELLFASGTHAISERGRAAIAQLARLVQQPRYAPYRIVVVGHSDRQPVTRPASVARYGDNWGLSAMRAAAVIAALREAGVPAARLRGAFCADQEPRRSGDRSGDRRVEIALEHAAAMRTQ